MELRQSHAQKSTKSFPVRNPRWNLTGEDREAVEEDGTNTRSVVEGWCVCVCVWRCLLAAHNLCAIFNQYTEKKKTDLCLCFTVSPAESRRIYREWMSSFRHVSQPFKSHPLTVRPCVNDFTTNFAPVSPHPPDCYTVRTLCSWSAAVTSPLCGSTDFRLSPPLLLNNTFESVSRPVILPPSCGLELKGQLFDKMIKP